MTCSVCHRAATVTLVHTLRVGKRVVEWRICSSCERKEQRNA